MSLIQTEAPLGYHYIKGLNFAPIPVAVYCLCVIPNKKYTISSNGVECVSSLCFEGFDTLAKKKPRNNITTNCIIEISQDVSWRLLEIIHTYNTVLNSPSCVRISVGSSATR